MSTVNSILSGSAVHAFCELRIESAANGYILTSAGATYVAGTLEELFDLILKRFEGRQSNLEGEHYGRVIVLRCTCHYQNLSTTETTTNACSSCSPRLNHP